tara:strand:+ start:11813 stop:11959 length:147 start_codon:yes stop_codon:yes gene_type:complete
MGELPKRHLKEKEFLEKFYKIERQTCKNRKRTGIFKTWNSIIALENLL